MKKKRDDCILRGHIIFLLLAVFIGLFILNEYTGQAYYQDYGYGSGYGFGGGYGGFGFLNINFTDFYYSYGSLIDAFLFLLIFMGVGKGVFKEHFKQGGTAVYTGLGIFLAFSLLLWEEQTGFSLLLEFGPFVFFAFLLVLFFYIYTWIKHSGAGGVFAGAATYILFWILYRFAYVQEKFTILDPVEAVIDLLFWASIAYSAGYILWVWGRKNKTP